MHRLARHGLYEHECTLECAQECVAYQYFEGVVALEKLSGLFDSIVDGSTSSPSEGHDALGGCVDSRHQGVAV